MVSPRALSPKQLKNERALKLYAASLCGILVIIIIGHWLNRAIQRFSHRSSSKEDPASSLRGPLLYWRRLEILLSKKVPGLPSLGHAVILGLFLAVNLILSFTSIVSLATNYLASRFGWLATANMALCVFLGLKNTPLAFLISAPYNYLNIFHRLVGFTSIFQVLLHTIFYMIYFGGQKGEWATLIEVENREGIVAGIIMLILLMGIFRHLNYELFYFMHIVAFMLTLILLALHRPDWKKKVPVAVVFIACIWGADRIIRGVRLLYNLANNSATIESLPDGGTRLILKKQLPGATPGKHCFVWIPAVRMCQTHPFTIVSNSTSGLELVMKSHKGFTKAALEFALSKAGHRVMASVDGPYGSLPNLSRYDKLILIAGGSGATFTFGLAANFVKHLETRSIESTQSMSFIWAVKKTNHLGWFKEHLSALKTQSSHVAVKLHVTGQELSSSPDLRIEKKSKEVTSNVTATKEHDSMNDNIEANTSGNSSDDSPDAVEFEEVVYGKMIPENTILEAMQHLNRNSRVLIAACGPVSLLDAVATTVGSLDVAEVPIIEVHYEKFDW